MVDRMTSVAGDGRNRLRSRLIWAKTIVLVLVLGVTSIISGCAGVVGAGTPPPGPSAFLLNPGSIDFGYVAAGKKVPQQVSVVNSGGTAIQITALTVSSPAFSVSGATLPMALAAGQTTSFSVWFDGKTAGKATGTLTAQADGGAAPEQVTLTGTGLGLSAGSSSLSFAGVKVGTASTQNLLISNISNADITISQISVNAKDVTVSGVTLPVTLSATQSLNATVQFKPVTSESVTGTIAFLDSLGGSLGINVTATGIQGVLTPLPTGLAFGNVVDGVTNSQPVQISNTGNGSLTVSQVTMSGSGFSVSGLAVPLVLAAGQSSSFDVLFAPQSAGSVTGSLTLTSDASSSPNTLALSGTGVAATRTLSLSQSGITFGNVNIGGSSSQPLTLTNTGNSNVTISKITWSGAEYSLAGASTPVVLSPSQGTTVTVNFNPTFAGSATGNVAVSSDATGSPANIPLSGNGVAPTPHTVLLSWVASTSTVSGYFIYRSTTNGSGYTKLNTSSVSSLNYTDSNVTSGWTYYYVTSAVDGSGTESIFSNQASASIP
jgi:hypothetical protein